MKKIFMLMAAVGVVFGANAAKPVLNHTINSAKAEAPVKQRVEKVDLSKSAARKAPKSRNLSLNTQLQLSTPQINKSHAQVPMMRKSKVLSARKVDNYSSIEGLWTWVFLDDLYEESTGGNVTVNYECTYDPDNDLYWFDDPTNDELPFGVQFDATTGEVILPAIIIGSTGTYYVSQEPFYIDDIAMDFAFPDELSWQFDFSKGSMELDEYAGITWGAYNEAYQYLGDFNGYYFETAVLTSGSNPGGGDSGSSDTSIEGTWEFTLGDWYNGEQSQGSVTAIFEATLYDDGYVYFLDPQENELPFGGLYDAAASTVSFDRIAWGTISTNDGQSYYLFQEPFEYNYTTQKLDPLSAVIGKFNAAKGTLTFQPDQGLTWSGYTDANGTDFAGYFLVLDLEGAKKLGVGGEDSDWTDIGNATFMDGWVLPAFGIDQTDESNWYEVPMQRNNTNSNLYRLVDPYHIGAAKEFNESTTVGYIEFDVTDPKHVVFNKANAGFANSSIGVTVFYCYNQLGSLLAQYPQFTVQDIIQAIADEIPYTTYENGVVNLNYTYYEGEIWYDANFGYQSDPTGGYGWEDQSGDTANMLAKIFFPGEYSAVGSVEVEEEAAPEFFNLQGVKVANPEKGQIIIVRKGSKAEKVIVK